MIAGTTLPDRELEGSHLPPSAPAVSAALSRCTGRNRSRPRHAGAAALLQGNVTCDLAPGEMLTGEQTSHYYDRVLSSGNGESSDSRQFRKIYAHLPAGPALGPQPDAEAASRHVAALRISVGARVAVSDSGTPHCGPGNWSQEGSWLSDVPITYVYVDGHEQPHGSGVIGLLQNSQLQGACNVMRESVVVDDLRVAPDSTPGVPGVTQNSRVFPDELRRPIDLWRHWKYWYWV